jgi:hypothetical protein
LLTPVYYGELLSTCPEYPEHRDKNILPQLIAGLKEFYSLAAVTRLPSYVDKTVPPSVFTRHLLLKPQQPDDTIWRCTHRLFQTRPDGESGRVVQGCILLAVGMGLNIGQGHCLPSVKCYTCFLDTFWKI